MYKSDHITFGRLHTWTLSFYHNRNSDTLAIRAPWPQEGVWVEAPENIRIKVDPQTGEAFELELGRFNEEFLFKHKRLAEQFGQIKPSPIALRRMENTPFISELLTHLGQLISNPDGELVPPDNLATHE